MNARDLATRLSDLLRREHEAMAEFLLALADFDRRRAWEELGYSSLFVFLHRQLRLSKGAASYRATAAALIQRIPEVVEPLRDGRMCLSTIFEVAKVLTPENRTEVLPRFFHRSKDEARELVAELMPNERPPARTMIVPVRCAAASTPPRVAAETDSSALAAPSPSTTSTGWPADLLDAKVPARTVNAPTVRPARHTFEPLTGDLFRMHLTVPKRLKEKLEAARDALSHSHPGATEEEVLEAGLDLLLERAAKRNGLVTKPQAAQRPSKPGHIPAAVKRAVWARDGGCCAWRLEDGSVCGSRRRVQYDHVRPEARGGESTVENVRLLCQAHNLLAARRIFGDAWMDRFRRGREAANVERDRDASDAPQRPS
jgi:5-methylcytosine-specific restriction endonuclease McrA